AHADDHRNGPSRLFLRGGVLTLLRRLRYAVTNPRRVLETVIDRLTPRADVAHGVRTKRYSSYGAYLRHQGAKLGRRREGWLAAHEQTYATTLRARLERHKLVTPGLRVLCLAARLGGHGRTFRALGASAVGIDLNPGRGNPYVCYGDFHALSFADGTVDLVFTNSLDHAYDFRRLADEIRRVLTSDGVFVTEIVKGAAAGVRLGYYDSAHWDSID